MFSFRWLYISSNVMRPCFLFDACRAQINIYLFTYLLTLNFAEYWLFSPDWINPIRDEITWARLVCSGVIERRIRKQTGTVCV